LGRYLPDGNVEYLGRNDYQVKINGCRIELGEIESRLLDHPLVREAVVLARDDRSGDKRLVAYYTSTDGENIPAKELHRQLSGVLAQFMMPAAYVRLLQLPLNVNGKLDRAALPMPDTQAYDWRLAERHTQAAR
jgi:arthrofactin-type cyclic lipopeptide synthetase C